MQAQRRGRGHRRISRSLSISISCCNWFIPLFFFLPPRSCLKVHAQANNRWLNPSLRGESANYGAVWHWPVGGGSPRRRFFNCVTCNLRVALSLWQVITRLGAGQRIENGALLSSPARVGARGLESCRKVRESNRRYVMESSKMGCQPWGRDAQQVYLWRQERGSAGTLCALAP